jgi:hypothetical protein
MGLKAKAVRQRVVFNPLIEPLITEPVHRIFAGLIKRYPEKASLAKVEGMIRFYLNGKSPINQQEWPECLEQEKPEFIIA